MKAKHIHSKDSKARARQVVSVARLPRLGGRAGAGVLRLGAGAWPCRLGEAAVAVLKHEGDRATPAGRFRLLRVLYRADRIRRPAAALPIRAIRRRDGWCDAPGDRNYNRPVRLPYGASAEELWRKDRLYDLVVVLGHNDRPRVKGRGSAVFLHVAPPGGAPTAGCVALACADLARLLARLRPGDRLAVRP